MNSLFPVKYHFQKKYFNNKHLSLRNKFWLLNTILFFVLVTSSVPAKSKEITSKYNLEMMGAKVGEFSVTQKIENGKLNIEAITDIKVKLLFSYRVKYVQNTVYEQGVLKSSKVKTYKNGKLNSDMVLKQQKDAYLLVVDGDTAVVNDSITYSGSLLYFNEPLGIKQLYKERTAEMMQITSLSEHTYVVNDEKEKELNRYIYKNGVLEYAKMRHALGMLELKRVTENTVND
ncbi:DUF6134 family protein [Maribellus maritimus]|uniref:DUF6134 family protein n=1 Tax=Maribellus maritimus TaxID=2870838 RepID=UPI001EEAAAAD|nr:DUF6134 family protein [Maribellus maritimus]MCG6190394.1 DUF6134 family protein [Maribellus maritimus]